MSVHCECVCVGGMHVHMSGTQGSQKRALDSLVLKLSQVVSHHVGAGNRAHIFGRNNTSALNC